MKTIPYTYKLFFLPTQQYYYGVRYAEGCNPSDLWVKYFSSSKHIHQLIKDYGLNSFTYKVTKTFKQKSEAVKHEKEVLVRCNASKNGKFINKSNNMPNYSNKGLIVICNTKLQIETFHDKTLPLPVGWKVGVLDSHKQKNSISHKGRTPWNKNKKLSSTGPCTQKRRNSISESRLKTTKLHCVFCNKDYDPGNYKKFHGENCKLNPNLNPEVLKERSEKAKKSMQLQKERGTYSKPKLVKGSFICPYCNKTSSNYGNMMKNHFDRCKLNNTSPHSSSDII